MRKLPQKLRIWFRLKPSRSSIALAGRAFGVSETCYRYSPLLSDATEVIADLLLGLTNAKKTWGFGLCFLHLRNLQGRASAAIGSRQWRGSGPTKGLSHLLRTGAEPAE